MMPPQAQGTTEPNAPIRKDEQAKDDQEHRHSSKVYAIRSPGETLGTVVRPLPQR
jgi:hypothetical protein